MSFMLSQRRSSLKALKGVEELRIYQELEICEILLRIQTKNRYVIRTADGKPLFYAVEHSCFLCRWICRSYRPFQMRIYDMEGKEAVLLKRRLACSGCCCPCCPLQKVRIFSPTHRFLGTVEEKYHCCSPGFRVKNIKGKAIFEIRGPCYAACPGASMLVADFNIYDLKGREVGSITKEWGGLMRELFTNSDFFTLRFPKYLSKDKKAILLSACFLIDFMYYEK